MTKVSMFENKTGMYYYEAMTTATIEKKIAPILPRGERTLTRFVRDALFLQLQEISKKIALFEGKHNGGFSDFERKWKKMPRLKKNAYETESDYMDWEALEDHKRALIKVIHSME